MTDDAKLTDRVAQGAGGLLSLGRNLNQLGWNFLWRRPSAAHAPAWLALGWLLTTRLSASRPLASMWKNGA
jgi:hypothetical protein